MNSFLTNMLDRNRGVSDIVKPRPRSRFEQDTRPLPTVKTDSGDSDIRHDDSEIEQIKNAPLPQRSYVSRSQVDQILPRPLILENQNPNTDRETPQSQQPRRESHSGLVKDIPRSRDDGQSIVERVQPSIEPLPFKHDIASFADRRAQREITNPQPNRETGSPPIDEGSFQIDLPQRIQTLLQRLQNHEKSQGNADTEVQPSIQLPYLSRTGEQETNIPLDGPESDNQSVEDKGITRSSPGFSGALQIPAWLSDMQTDLNSRWREINAKSKVEPVVNVTIGHVEVRAVQAETVKQAKPQKKPTGVMSLDDYLRQREYGDKHE